MTVEARIVLVGLATFGTFGLLATVVVPFVERRRARGSAADRAARLANLRLLPTAIAAIGSAIVTAAFIWFEPRWDGEDLGVTLQAVAMFAAALLVTSAWRGLRLLRATRRTAERWLRHARPIALTGISAPSLVIDSDFPVVTVVGLRRPRLVIAQSVLDSCSDDELRAILAHEQGHIDRHDNVRRLLLSVAPDILGWFPVSTRMFAEWSDAAEEAADDDADHAGEGGRVRLAAALLKVARLAPSNVLPAPMPASALYRGESLERRVRRLLEAPRRESLTFSRAWPFRLALALAAVTSLTMLERVHAAVEALIHTLP